MFSCHRLLLALFLTIGGIGTAAAPAVAAAPWSEPLAVGGTLPIVDAQLATHASNGFVVAGSTPAAGRSGPRKINDTRDVRVAFGTPAGVVGAPRVLPASAGEHVYALASNHAGDVAIVVGNTKQRRVLIRRHREPRSFHLALTIKVSNKARGATVAVGAAGDVLAMWEDRHQIFTRRISRSGGVGTRMKVGDGVRAELQAAIDPSGRAMVAWAVRDWSESRGSASAATFFATAAHNRPFGRPRQLAGVSASEDRVPVRGVRLVTGQDGTTILALTTYAGDTGPLAVAVAPVIAGRVGYLQELPGVSGGDLAGLAVGPDGSAIVLWRSIVTGRGEGLFASVSPGAGQPFGDPEALPSAMSPSAVTPTAAAGGGGGTLALVPTSTQGSSVVVAARRPIAP